MKETKTENRVLLHPVFFSVFGLRKFCYVPGGSFSDTKAGKLSRHDRQKDISSPQPERLQNFRKVVPLIFGAKLLYLARLLSRFFFEAGGTKKKLRKRNAERGRDKGAF